jgi:lipopolysaccharide export LptBFGC system permease protein LptF
MLSGLLLGLLALPMVFWNQRTQSAESGLLVLILLFWDIVVMGHILKHTFEMPFNVGIAAAMIYTILSWNLTALFFPVAL